MEQANALSRHACTVEIHASVETSLAYVLAAHTVNWTLVGVAGSGPLPGGFPILARCDQIARRRRHVWQLGRLLGRLRNAPEHA